MSIDYGMGRTNIDRVTGIRFGVISQNSIMQAWADCSQGVYPCATCECGDLERDDCEAEATEFEYQEDGYDMQSCLDSDVMVLRSRWFTYGPFCSPCVPGAVNLDGAARAWVDELTGAGDRVHHGAPGYCVDHDWFDNGVAPYRVFSVANGREVFPDSYYGC